MSTRSLSSGELARKAGVNPETLRYYERRGLLPRPARTASGHRRYDAEALTILKLIKRAQELDFSLVEVREILRWLELPQAACSDMCRVIEAKIGRVDQELARLKGLRTRLARFRDSCPTTRPLRDCPAIVELKGTTVKRRG
jgi:DNA-binding transcriptional MerR regulator